MVEELVVEDSDFVKSVFVELEYMPEYWNLLEFKSRNKF